MEKKKKSMSLPEGTIYLKNLPEDLPIFLLTGYMDYHAKGVSNDEYIFLLVDYDMEPDSRCLLLLCDKKASRFAIAWHDGDGNCLLEKTFFSKKLKWPRNGGTTDQELWSLTRQQFLRLMDGGKIKDDEVPDEFYAPLPGVGQMKSLMYLIEKCRLRTFYVCTGYTNLPSDWEELSYLVESFGVDPMARPACFFFCGRKATEYKALLYDGDGVMTVSKVLHDFSLHWPRVKNELWLLSPEMTIQLLRGEKITRADAENVLTREEDE